jgi:hypothetical protein
MARRRFTTDDALRWFGLGGIGWDFVYKWHRNLSYFEDGEAKSSQKFHSAPST